MARSSSSTIALAVLIGAAGTFAVVDAHAGTCPELIGPVQEMGDSFHAGASTGHDQAQTFTVTQAGRIEAVELMGGTQFQLIHPSSPLFADLRPVENDVPVESNSSALASVQIPLSALPYAAEYRPWYRIEFGDQGPMVQPGQSLALVLRVDGSGTYSVSWSGRFESVPGDAYAGGRMYTRQTPHGSWFTLDGQPDIYFGPRNMDFAIRVVMCQPAVAATPTTWGRLKTRYD
jgi:hypothetical protein